MADSGEAAAFLPSSIREALKRKSSRDPSSRFPTKLHLLLAYVDEHPDMAEKVGVEWLPDDEFRMNKAVLSEVMGIKINTLNVNLRDRMFTQLQRDKEGWTKWRRDGFTKTSRGLEYETEVGQAPQRRQNDPVGMPQSAFGMMEPDFETHTYQRVLLGKLTAEEQQRFDRKARDLWYEITGSLPDNTPPMDQEQLIAKIADRFKYHEQPLTNSIEVIKAIIAPTNAPISFYEFSKLLAMFGPEETIMLKISSLLKCSNSTGQWLRFDNTCNQKLYPGGSFDTQKPSGSFDPQKPNCLQIYRVDGTCERVYNHPLRDAEDNTRPYIIDENNGIYQSWDAYFSKNPVGPTVAGGYY